LRGEPPAGEATLYNVSIKVHKKLITLPMMPRAVT
jgi:hypothetical protein